MESPGTESPGTESPGMERVPARRVPAWRESRHGGHPGMEAVRHSITAGTSAPSPLGGSGGGGALDSERWGRGLQVTTTRALGRKGRVWRDDPCVLMSSVCPGKWPELPIRGSGWLRRTVTPLVILGQPGRWLNTRSEVRCWGSLPPPRVLRDRPGGPETEQSVLGDYYSLFFSAKMGIEPRKTHVPETTLPVPTHATQSPVHAGTQLLSAPRTLWPLPVTSLSRHPPPGCPQELQVEGARVRASDPHLSLPPPPPGVSLGPGRVHSRPQGCAACCCVWGHRREAQAAPGRPSSHLRVLPRTLCLPVPPPPPPAPSHTAAREGPGKCWPLCPRRLPLSCVWGGGWWCQEWTRAATPASAPSLSPQVCSPCLAPSGCSPALLPAGVPDTPSPRRVPSGARGAGQGGAPGPGGRPRAAAG
ncbi:basic proline-rich protein-like [Sorex araneus]|uniref:basic proline-rich protein-like n=1 Tax=Sorex araneus TaxID=42254 RepID=UPI0024337838|nr:basic proline-rich protein-like [Sorex araneus]